MTTPTASRTRPFGAVGIAACLCAAGVAAALAAGDPATPAGTFEESADVHVVEVPVQVIRGGQPVRGLTAADFTVWAGKQKQPIIGFEAIDVDALDAGGAPAMTLLPTSGRRHFLFLFDLSYSDPHALVRAQQAALQIAREDLRPSDLAGVGVFSPARGWCWPSPPIGPSSSSPSPPWVPPS